MSLAVGGRAFGQESTAPPSTPAPAAAAPAATAPAATAPAATDGTAAPAAPATKSDLDFNLFGDEKKKSPLDEAREADRIARLERSVRLRRKLLVAHQILGFATLAAVAATDVIGQLNYDDKYTKSGSDTGKFYNTHEDLGIITTALFATTGVLALAAPNPYPKPIKLDAALLHKASMAAAAACLLLQIVLGPITATRDGKADQRDLVITHLVSGYGMFAFMSVGTLSYVF
ncbi:MAG TPA: hypothetical protein VHB97_13970 [Polyangia bacterium]|nr:hypothetical protein [Polyangia bacterium]